MNLEKGHGKRFPLKDRNSGKIKDAYGFDLSPLLARKREFAAAVAIQERSLQELKACNNVLGATRRELKILRDAFAKLNLPDLQEEADRAAASALPLRSRKTTIEEINRLLLAAESARTRLEQAYLDAFKLEAFEAEKRGGDATKKVSCGAQMCKHIYRNTDINSIEDCSKQTHAREISDARKNPDFVSGRKDETIKTFDEENAEPKKEALEERGMRSPAPQVLNPFLWHQACPELKNYTKEPALTSSPA